MTIKSVDGGTFTVTRADGNFKGAMPNEEVKVTVIFEKTTFEEGWVND